MFHVEHLNTRQRDVRDEGTKPSTFAMPTPLEIIVHPVGIEPTAFAM